MRAEIHTHSHLVVRAEKLDRGVQNLLNLLRPIGQDATSEARNYCQKGGKQTTSLKREGKESSFSLQKIKIPRDTAQSQRMSKSIRRGSIKEAGRTSFFH